MKEIDLYINEKLSLNPDSKISSKKKTYKSDSDKFEVDVTRKCWLTKKQIGIIIDYFENFDILPEVITNYWRGSKYDAPCYRDELYVYWKGPSDKKIAPRLTFRKNIDGKFRIYIQWPYPIGGFGDTDETGYPGNNLYGDEYVTFDWIMKRSLPKAMSMKIFIDRIKEYQNN